MKCINSSRKIIAAHKIQFQSMNYNCRRTTKFIEPSHNNIGIETKTTNCEQNTNNTDVNVLAVMHSDNWFDSF